MHSHPHTVQLMWRHLADFQVVNGITGVTEGGVDLLGEVPKN